MKDFPYPLLSQPGVMRDGSSLESQFYADGEWVRWQRGRPRKMGGYRAMSTLVNGPTRSVLVDSRNAINTAHYFSQYGVQRQQFSNDGAGGGLADRTPVGFYGGVGDPLLTWSHSILASSTGGTFAALIAAATPDILDIASDVKGNVWTGGMDDSAPLTRLMDGANPLQVSGGVTVLHPFPVVYGSAGLIKIGSPNDLSASTWTPGGGSLALEANVAGTKIVYGAPVRGGGQSPAGLFWALDALVRASWIGGSGAVNDPLWRFDTLTQPTSILSKKCVIEHDGKFFWIGTDRFLMYNGVVQELPNQMNCNWFFEGLNYAQRNKVWGTKIPRYGELWWFYPRGDATECTHAIIYNYLENTWYDAEKMRTAGSSVQTFPFPIWAGSEAGRATTAVPVGVFLTTSAPSTMPTSTLTFANTAPVANGMRVHATGVAAGAAVSSFTATTIVLSAPITANVPAGTPVIISTMQTPFIPGEVVTGGTSGAVGTVVRADPDSINLSSVTGTFLPSEALTGSLGGTATTMGASYPQQLDVAYQQEYGRDRIVGQDVTAVRSSYTVGSFGLAIGKPPAPQGVDPDRMTVVRRLDPDFAQTGDLTVSVLGRSFVGQPFRPLKEEVLSPDEDFLSFKGAQERELQVKVESNVVNGFYEHGQVIIHVAPGDARSSSEK